MKKGKGMRINILTWCVLLMSLQGYSQDTLLSHPMLIAADDSVDVQKEFQFTAMSEVVFYGNGIGTRWLRDWARGGEISRASNQKQLSNLSRRTTALGRWSTQLDIQAPIFADSLSNPDVDNRIGISVTQNEVFRGSFDPQVFQLLFMGNKGLEGQNLSGKDVEIESFQYRSIGVNWNHSDYKNYNFWGVGLNWVESSQYSRWSIPHYNILFGQNMNDVQLDYVAKKQTLVNGSKGVGLSTNLEWENIKYPIHWYCGIKDLGFVKYKQLQMDRWKGDGLYPGFNTQTLQNEDSLANFLAPFAEHKQRIVERWVALPTSFNANFEFLRRWRYSMVYYFGGQWGYQSLGKAWMFERGNQSWQFRLDALRSFQEQWGMRGSVHYINHNGWNIALVGNNWLRTAVGDAPFFSGHIMLNMAF